MDGARGWFWEAVEPFPSLLLASYIDSYFNIILRWKLKSTNHNQQGSLDEQLQGGTTIIRPLEFRNPTSNNTQTKSFCASSQFKYLQ